jgi:creatinine amidohydrolase
MQWEQLTATDLAEAVRHTRVSVLAIGVLEKHSEHLPLGTDYLVAHAIACRAAELEPAVVFPPFYFGQIYEARCFPGAVTLKPTLLLDVFQGVLDEIGRNGFKKIIIYSAHGGNTHFLRFLSQSALWQERPYSLYIPERMLSPEGEEEWKKMRDTELGGHACEWETSMVLAIHPELVKMDRIPEQPASPLNRMRDLPPTHTGISWYSDYPDHYAGDARPATREKGQTLLRFASDYLAQYIAAVKADRMVPTLMAEFFRRAEEIGEA